MIKRNPTPNSSTVTPESGVFNILGQGTKIVGEIISNGDIRIDGNLKGNITTKGKLVIGNTGIVIGNISCKNSDISGKVEGKVIVEELLALKSTSEVQGDIVTSKLSIEPGALLNGTCNMNRSSSPQNDGR